MAVQLMGRIIKAKLELKSNLSEILPVKASLSVILLQLKLTKLKLQVFNTNSDFQHKKKDMNNKHR